MLGVAAGRMCAVTHGTGTSTVPPSSSGTDTYSGSLSGANGVKKTGTGTLTFTAANSYTGELVVEQGTLAASTPANFGSMKKITVKEGAPEENDPGKEPAESGTGENDPGKTPENDVSPWLWIALGIAAAAVVAAIVVVIVKKSNKASK